MNVHTYIRKFAESAEVDVTPMEVAAIAGTLKTAGFTGELTSRDMDLARSIVATRIGRISGARPKVAETSKVEAEEKKDHVVEANKDAATFEKIDTMIKQGKCARCGQPTEKVSLAKYDEVHYCPQCRTTLW